MSDVERRLRFNNSCFLCVAPSIQVRGSVEPDGDQRTDQGVRLSSTKLFAFEGNSNSLKLN
jgi:hypothetical protein